MQAPFEKLPDETVTESVGGTPKSSLPLDKDVDTSKANASLADSIRRSVEKHPCYLPQKPNSFFSLLRYDEFRIQNNQTLVSNRAVIYPAKSKGTNADLVYKILNCPNQENVVVDTAKIIIYENNAYLAINQELMYFPKLHYQLYSSDDLEKIFTVIPSASVAVAIWIWFRGLILNENFPLTACHSLGISLVTVFLIFLPFSIDIDMQKNTLLKIANAFLLVFAAVCWISAGITAIVGTVAGLLPLLIELTAKALIFTIVFPVIAFIWVAEKTINAISSIVSRPVDEEPGKSKATHAGSSFFSIKKENKPSASASHTQVTPFPSQSKEN